MFVYDDDDRREEFDPSDDDWAWWCEQTRGDDHGEPDDEPDANLDERAAIARWMSAAEQGLHWT